MNIARAVRADDFIVQHHLHPDCDDKKKLNSICGRGNCINQANKCSLLFYE